MKLQTADQSRSMLLMFTTNAYSIYYFLPLSFTCKAIKINITISFTFIYIPVSYFCETSLILSDSFKEKEIKIADILVLYCREYATSY